MAPATSGGLLIFPCPCQDRRVDRGPVRTVPSPPPEPIDDDWDGVTATVTLADRFGPEALMGLGEFSHVEVVFVFDRVPPEKVQTLSRQRAAQSDRGDRVPAARRLRAHGDVAG